MLVPGGDWSRCTGRLRVTRMLGAGEVCPLDVEVEHEYPKRQTNQSADHDSSLALNSTKGNGPCRNVWGMIHLLSAMASMRRVPRVVATLLALLQLTSPGLVAVADGFVQRAAMGAPSTHIEATSSAACPAVHSPDCAMCRFVSMSSQAGAPPTAHLVPQNGCHAVIALRASGTSRDLLTPFGRAPPSF